MVACIHEWAQCVFCVISCIKPNLDCTRCLINHTFNKPISSHEGIKVPWSTATSRKRKRTALPQACFHFLFYMRLREFLSVWALCRGAPATAGGTVSTGISTVGPRPSFGFKHSNKIARKGLQGQMQNISCPIWHGNAPGLAQQELEDEAEENDLPLSLVCCKWGGTSQENIQRGNSQDVCPKVFQTVLRPEQYNQTGYSGCEQWRIAEWGEKSKTINAEQSQVSIPFSSKSIKETIDIIYSIRLL